LKGESHKRELVLEKGLEGGFYIFNFLIHFILD
jgi:hypothetical protein